MQFLNVLLIKTLLCRGRHMDYFIIAILVVSLPFLLGYFIYKNKRRNPPKHPKTNYKELSKGERGEKIVADILGDTIPHQQYVIHNLLFQINSRKSCEIDHIYINQYGVWVIETKNYSGTIYGNDKQLKWTQVLHSGEKNQFYNPIKQNATHIYHLTKVLNMQNKFFHTVVVFLNADISNIPIDTLYTQNTVYTIKNKPTKIQLSVRQMETIYNKLLQLKENSSITKEEHIQNIHREQQSIEYGFCPRCGRQLVLRHGKYGDFYGCPNYPKCTFKKNID